MGTKRGNTRNSTNNKGTTRLVRGQGAIMYKSPRMIMPAQYVTSLSYLVDYIVTAVGASQTSIQYRTEAFDVDPALGSTAMPGFAEMATFYQRYRPLRMSYQFDVANQEAFTMAYLHGFSNSAISAASLNLQYAGNPTFKTAVVGPATGMNTKTFRGSTTVVNLRGTQQPLFDDLFTGSTTSATLATAGTTYCYLGLISPAAMTALGSNVIVKITLQLQFYGLKPLLT